MRYDFERITAFTHQILEDYLKSGDVAIDATCGNGNDTLYLSNRVGKTGRVVAIDIQSQSIKNTRILIDEKSEYPDNVIMVQESHHLIDQIIERLHLKKPSVIMFNLGYLPGNKNCVLTQKETTLEALKQSTKMLASGGIISIIFYPHETGIQEWELCKDFLENLTGDLNSFIFKRLNRNHPPFLVLITKK